MTWDPDGKITNFGQSFETMLIPDSSDPVASDEDPGGTPIAISAMTSASGIVFGKITNNIQFVKKRVLTEDLTLSVTSSAEFLTAQAAISEIEHIDDGVTLSVEFSSGFSLSGDDTYFPLEFHGITGGGGIINVTGQVGSPAILQSSGNYDVLSFQHVDCAVAVQYVNLDTTGNVSVDVLHATYCKAMTLYEVEFLNVPTGSVNAIYAGGPGTLQIAGVTFGDNYENYIYGEYGKIIEVTSPSFGVPDSGGLYVCLTKGCRLIWNALDDSHFSMGSSISDVNLFSIDASCQYDALSFGTAGTITMAATGASYVLRDLQRLLNCMPRKISDSVLIEIPNGTYTNVNSDVVLDGFYATDKNVELKIRAENNIAGPSTSQPVIFDVDGTGKCGIEIQECDVPIVIDSIKFDSDNSHGVYVQNSRDVTISNCYLVTTDSLGDDGINFSQDCTGLVDSCVFGSCGNNGIEANYRSHIHCETCEVQGVDPNEPENYGVLAQSGSVISYATSGWTLTGGDGDAYAATGGETRSG